MALYNIYNMIKTKKNNSKPNVGMPKSNYDKALEYYNLQGKSARQVASRINYTPTIKVKVKGKPEKQQTITDTKSERYINKVKDELIKRWKDATTQVIGIYSLRFKRYDKQKKRYYDAETKFNVTGNKANINELAELEFDKRVRIYQEQYDESRDFQYQQSGEIIPVGEKTGSGVDNGKTITTTKGGQRKVGMKGHKAVIKMRDSFSLKFSNDEQEWDRGQGTCVFDYIYTHYKCKGLNGTKTKPKTRDEAYIWLDELLRIDETERPLIDGVSVYQLENFCDHMNCNMYVYDETEGLIEYYKSKKPQGNTESLMFVVYDGHFNPIPNDKRKSLSIKASQDKPSIKSNDIERYENKKKETETKTYEIIAPTQEEYDAIKEQLKQQNYPISVRNQVALNYLKENGMKVPYPLTGNNLYVVDNAIVKMKYDDKIILTEPINPKIQKWCMDNDIEFKGDDYGGILNRIWLNKYGFTIDDAPFLSKPNVEVLNALSANKVKYRTHLGLTYDGQQYNQESIINMLNNGDAISVDISKCYCDALYNPRERWIVFNGKELLEEYDRKPLTLGLYFIITDDMTLFHKSNWYSKQIITKAIQEGIKFKISHQIRCVDVEWEREKYDENDMSIWKLNNANLFKDIIDEIVELTEQDEDFTITKVVINSLSGCLGKTSYISKTASLNTKLSDIWENWIVADKDKVIENNENIYISEMTDGDRKLYLYGVEKKVEYQSSGLPMYIQILDSSNIALYDMIKAVGGTCIYRKTDCIVSIGGKLPDDRLINYPCSYQDTWGRYRLVDDGINFNYDVVMNEYRAVEIPRLSKEWEHWDFNDSNDWKFILETAITKGGMLISGRAGTGKSYIIKKGIEAGLLSPEKETRMSFTNKAARNIDGMTIHNNMKLDINNKTNYKTINYLGKYEIFVVDEISMINRDLWDKLCLLKKTTGAIFILLGDYRQCPPIEIGNSVDYFNHPYAKYLSNYNICELTIPQRYDMKLWNWLEDFYERLIVGDDIVKKKLTIDNILYRKNICFMNKTRRNINELCMKEKIKDMTRFMVLDVPEKCSNKYAQLTYIYKDLPVMAIVCNKSLDIINSDEFIVTDFDPNNSNITMKSEYTGDELTIDNKEFHKSFVVNYAATTHKSQGATITEDINLWDWEWLRGDREVGYTAVSRAKCCEQLTIVVNQDELFQDDNAVDDEQDWFDPPDDDC